jgi:hypothetical protein
VLQGRVDDALSLLSSNDALAFRSPEVPSLVAELLHSLPSIQRGGGGVGGVISSVGGGGGGGATNVDAFVANVQTWRSTVKQLRDEVRTEKERKRREEKSFHTACFGRSQHCALRSQ